MKTYCVTIPIAGHFTVEVEANCEAEAIEKALVADTDDGEVTWEQLNRFVEGHVCYCPHPWEIEVECEDEDEGGSNE